MAKVEVTVLQSHYGEYGQKKAGDVYETTESHAAELKRNGLVEYGGPAAKSEKVEHILVSDKKTEKVEIKKPTTK